MAEDMMLRVPARLREPLEQIAKEEFRRGAADAARALLERSIFDRVVARTVNNKKVERAT